MDIQHLVDRLEDLIDVGRHVPATKFTLIDEERALEIIDQMRISIPEQIEKATRIVNQRDRLISQANDDAARMIELANKKSEELVDRDSIVQAARQRAENIIRQAEQEANQVRDEADMYVTQVLKELEGQLLRTLTIVRNGITKVTQEREVRHQHMNTMQQAAQVYQQNQEAQQAPLPLPTEQSAPASPTPAEAQKPTDAPQRTTMRPPTPRQEAKIEKRELVDADTGE